MVKGLKAGKGGGYSFSQRIKSGAHVGLCADLAFHGLEELE